MRISIALMLGATFVGGHELITTRLTWTEQVSRIFHKRCVSCHHDGGSAPMPLETYAQVRPWASAIKKAVLNRQMPPWSAVKGFGSFRNDLSLPQQEIAVISSWAEGGAPEGDCQYLAATHRHETADEEAAPDPLSLRNIVLSGVTELAEGVTAISIRAETVEEGGSLQAVAHRPDGSIEHLVWVERFNPSFRRTYEFRVPLPLPAGARIVLKPEGVTASLQVIEK